MSSRLTETDRAQLRHALAFTKIENSALIYWLRTYLAGYRTEANIAMSDGLLLEHFNSGCPNDERAWTAGQRLIADELARIAKRSEDAAEDAIGTKSNEDETANEHAESVVERILKDL